MLHCFYDVCHVEGGYPALLDLVESRQGVKVKCVKL